jgi:REP element-mobilizing transposase RayT
VAKNIIGVLLETAVAKSFLAIAYCLMPDHMHMPFEGTRADSQALEFVRVFKQRTGFQFRENQQKALWELSFHDRVLRSGDSIIEIARYIWWNPVRKKLCERPCECPYSGSQPFSWMKEAQIPPSSSVVSR